jgi:hypothetical protein
MEEQKLKKSSGGIRIKIEAICAVVTSVLAGLAGTSIPIVYLHTHLDSFFNTWYLGPIIFDLVVILFGMIFLIAWIIIWLQARKFVENLPVKNDGQS